MVFIMKFILFVVLAFFILFVLRVVLAFTKLRKGMGGMNVRGGNMEKCPACHQPISVGQEPGSCPKCGSPLGRSNEGKLLIRVN